jgi:2'-5' RNA ligase
MRLFTAVLFDEDRKNEVYHTVERLGRLAEGNFTDRENLHLTVNFIGETDQLKAVEQAMENAVAKTKATTFELSIRGIGRFRRNEGDIWWIGIEKSDTLWKLQKEIAKELIEAGFKDIDTREYKPHLTLGRKVVVKPGFNPKEFEEGITPMQQKVNKISLMKSERLRGKLVYTEIFSVHLNQLS